MPENIVPGNSITSADQPEFLEEAFKIGWASAICYDYALKRTSNDPQFVDLYGAEETANSLIYRRNILAVIGAYGLSTDAETYMNGLLDRGHEFNQERYRRTVTALGQMVTAREIEVNYTVKGSYEAGAYRSPEPALIIRLRRLNPDGTMPRGHHEGDELWTDSVHGTVVTPFVPESNAFRLVTSPDQTVAKKGFLGRKGQKTVGSMAAYINYVLPELEDPSSRLRFSIAEVTRSDNSA